MSAKRYERVWLQADTGEVWFIKPVQSSVEFVRADKLEELAAENEALKRNINILTSPAYLADLLGTVGVVDAEWQERAEKAEAALAEAKRENEALQKQVMMLGVQLDDMMFLSVEGFLEWQREQRELRNAGGNDA